MFLMKVGAGQQMEYIKGASGYAKRDAYMEVRHLDVGHYIWYSSVDWVAETDEAIKNYSVTAYGSRCERVVSSAPQSK